MPVGSLDKLFPNFETRADIQVRVVDREVDPA